MSYYKEKIEIYLEGFLKEIFKEIVINNLPIEEGITYSSTDLTRNGKKIGTIYIKNEKPPNSDHSFTFRTLKFKYHSKKYVITIAGIIHDDKIDKFKLPITGIETNNKKIKNDKGFIVFKKK
jgi:hypothetical protein